MELSSRRVLQRNCACHEEEVWWVHAKEASGGRTGNMEENEFRQGTKEPGYIESS